MVTTATIGVRQNQVWIRCSIFLAFWVNALIGMQVIIFFLKKSFENVKGPWGFKESWLLPRLDFEYLLGKPFVLLMTDGFSSGTTWRRIKKCPYVGLWGSTTWTMSVGISFSYPDPNEDKMHTKEKYRSQVIEKKNMAIKSCCSQLNLCLHFSQG